MRLLPTTGKPYVVPSDNPTAEALIRCYAWDIQRQPLLLANLRRPDGSLYLPKGEQPVIAYSAVYTHTNQPEHERTA